MLQQLEVALRGTKMTIHAAVLVVHPKNGAQPVSYLGEIADLGFVLRGRGEFG